MIVRIGIVVVVIAVAGLVLLHLLGTGLGVEVPTAGSPQARAIAPSVVASRAERQ